MSYIDDFINMVNDIECQKALDHFNANQPIEKGWVTTEDGNHIFIGEDGNANYGASAYEAYQNESAKTENTHIDTNEKTTHEAIVFKDDKEAQEYFGNDWESSLTDAEKGLIVNYTNSGHDGLNSMLRNLKNLEAIGAKMSEDTKKELDTMDSALAKQELKDAITVYRATSPEIFGLEKYASLNADDLQSFVGKTLTDAAYLSTSIDREAIKSFGNVVFDITVPPGKGRGAYIQKLSGYPEEKEFLLSRGSNLKIESISVGENNKVFVNAAVVD